MNSPLHSCHVEGTPRYIRVFSEQNVCICGCVLRVFVAAWRLSLVAAIRGCSLGVVASLVVEHRL